MPVLSKVEVLALSKVEVLALSKVEVPALSKVEVLALSKVEVPALSKVEVPALSKVEVPALSKVEVPLHSFKKIINLWQVALKRRLMPNFALDFFNQTSVLILHEMDEDFHGKYNQPVII